MSNIRTILAAVLLGMLSLVSAQTPTELPNLDLWNHGAVFKTEQEISGNLLIGGLFALAGGLPRNNLARLLLPENEVDPDFSPVIDGPVFAILQQGDGKILIGGQFSRVNGAARNNIARLNANGSLDTTWNPGANAPVFVFEGDGPDHILVGGTFSQVGGQTRRGLARLALIDAEVDSDWDPDVRGGGVFALARGTSDFWIGGNFEEVGGLPTRSIARLNDAGALVTAYEVDGSVESLSYDSKLGMYFCGRFSTVDGQQRSKLGRLDPDGVLDSFSIEVDHEVHHCRVSDGQILVSGQFVSINGEPVKGVARLSATGVVDPDFQPAIGGVFSGTPGTDVLVWTTRELANGQVFVGGVFRQVNGLPRGGAALLDAQDGQVLDPIHVEQHGEVRTVLTLEDGALIVGGRFWRSGDEFRDNVARVQPAGTLDPQWALPVNGDVLSGALLDDGSLTLGGFFTAAGGQARNSLVRLTLDDGPKVMADWSPGTDGAVLVIQQDQLDSERLYVAGAFTEIQTSQTYPRGAMARLSLVESGDPDDFNPDFDTQVNDLLQIPSSSRFYVAGVFDQAAGQPRRGIAAFIDDEGQTQLDTDFDAAANGNFWVLHAATHGESFYAGGEFTNLFGANRTRLAKIGPEFDQWTPSTNGTPVAMVLDGVGGLFVGGTFLILNGATRNRLARLDASDGTLDAKFNPGMAPGLVWNLVIGPGRLFVGGSFRQTAGLSRNGLAAFAVETPPLPDLIFSDSFVELIVDVATDHQPLMEEKAGEIDSIRAVECGHEINPAGAMRKPHFIRAPGCDLYGAAIH